MKFQEAFSHLARILKSCYYLSDSFELDEIEIQNGCSQFYILMI